MISAYLDDISVGDTRVTDGRTITETHVVNFARYSGDWHPIVLVAQLKALVDGKPAP